MVKQGGGGKIIFMSSIHEDVPFPQYTPYCVAKGGMRMLMRNIALELAPHKINCNNIAPGAIATPINRDTLNNPAKWAADRENPAGRIAAIDLEAFTRVAARTPGLTEAHIFTPAAAHDPFLKDPPPPQLAAQLYFDDLPPLER